MSIRQTNLPPLPIFNELPVSSQVLTIESALNEASQRLSQFDEARFEAQLLLSHVLQVSRTYLYAHANQLLSVFQQKKFLMLIERRCEGVPIAYLLGHRAFWSMDLEVNPSTLIPRPETECLIEIALKILPKEPISILDLGVGSGAIAIALALERPGWKLTGTDISCEALAIAEKNMRKYGIKNLELKQSNWCLSLPVQQFDAIVSNPPYIAEGDAHLQALKYEPLAALVAGPDGLSAIRTIIHQAKRYLKDNGWLLLEHGYNQAKKVQNLLKVNSYKEIATFADLNQVMRVTIGRNCHYFGRNSNEASICKQ